MRKENASDENIERALLILTTTLKTHFFPKKSPLAKTTFLKTGSAKRAKYCIFFGLKLSFLHILVIFCPSVGVQTPSSCQSLVYVASSVVRNVDFHSFDL